MREIHHSGREPSISTLRNMCMNVLEILDCLDEPLVHILILFMKVYCLVLSILFKDKLMHFFVLCIQRCPCPILLCLLYTWYFCGQVSD